MTSRNNKVDNKLLNRRRFIKTVAQGCAGVVGVSAVTYLAYGEKPVYHAPEKIYKLNDFRVDTSGLPRLIITHGDDPFMMVKAATEKLGGIDRFIKPGDRVVIKPNVAWDRLPEQAANTNPDVVLAVAKLVMGAKPASVTVTDVSLNDPYRSFARSGIEKAAGEAGAKLWIPGVNDFRQADLNGSLLKVWPVSRAFLEADKVINIPVVKHHSLSRATLAQKNWYGILGGRRNQLHQDIHTSIADLASAVRPTLTVMDATRVLMKNGPTGGSLSDVKVFNTIVVGLDEVAIDSYSLGLLGAKPDDVGYMKLSQERGLGEPDWKSIRYEELNV